jgi:hypothetical protein
MGLIHSQSTVVGDSLIFHLDPANPRSFPTSMVDGLYGERYVGYYNDDVTFFNTAQKHGNVEFTTDFSGFTSSSDGYSWMWTGLFYAPQTGTYTFYTASDDASMLWIGTEALSGYSLSNAVVDNRGLHGEVEKSGTIFLTRDTYYPIRIMLGESGGGDLIRVAFAGPSMSKIYNGKGFFFSNFSPWADLIGTNNLFLINSPTYSSTESGTLSFNGTTNNAITSSSIAYSENTSWDIWINRTSSVNAYNMFMGNFLPYFGARSANNFIFSNSIDGIQTTIESSGVTIQNNTWYHLVGTTEYNGTTTTMKLYINGALNPITATANGKQFNYGYKFNIGDGRPFDYPWYPFNGKIGSVKIYNKTLSASEVLQNYNALKSRYGL